MTKNTAKKAIIGILGALTLASFGGTASAQSGTEYVGGGTWTWTYYSGVHASSAYLHRSNRHSASAQVGNAAIKYDVQPANVTATASAWGVGVTRVWWNNQA